MLRRLNRSPLRPRSGRVLGMSGLVLTAGLVAAVAALAPAVRPRADNAGALAAVRRADFDAVVISPGWLESSQSTEIRCALERLATGGDVTILRLVDDGTTVKQGEVLCELDSSGYQELVRRQAITVEEARAAHRQAELNLEVARIGLEAYRQ